MLWNQLNHKTDGAKICVLPNKHEAKINLLTGSNVIIYKFNQPWYMKNWIMSLFSLEIGAKLIIKRSRQIGI